MGIFSVPLAPALCLAQTDPVGRFIAGAWKPIFFNEGLKEERSNLVALLPQVG